MDPIVQLALQQALQNAKRLHYAGRLAQAEAVCRQVLQQAPQHPEALQMLGALAAQSDRHDEALAFLRQAIALRPDFPEAYSNLADVLKDKGQLDEALAAAHKAVELNPALPMAHNTLGYILKLKGQSDEAIAAYQKAIALRPEVPHFYSNLAVALEDQGRLSEAMPAYRRAVDLEPRHPGFHSNLVYAMYFTDLSLQDLAKEMKLWNQVHAEPLRKFMRPFDNPRDPDRRLRIGYVSPDFYSHAQSYFTVPLLANHDRSQFEVFAYADVLKPDAITQRIRSLVDVWRTTVSRTDDQIAETVRADKIDILIDLSLHMARNRLLVFARKPAPVQVTWLGYPGSTGLRAIDYRITDPYLDPPGEDESVFSERVVRLPDSFWCYDPLAERDLPVSSLPALENGVITFGCLNNFGKIAQPLLRLWAQVLRQVEGSRLMLLTPVGSHRKTTTDFLAGEGIAPERIEFQPRQSRQDYMKLYHRIDIGLDSMPYNGHTTSLDSFWMGVPVVTQVGTTPVSRGGWCQLTNLGLPELAGRTPEDFVRIAVELAKDLPRLKELRGSLRQRMLSSPLMDAPCFAKNMEAAYREMWRNWCAKKAARK